MYRAVWNGAVLAESIDTIVVEGNHYFPFDSLRHEYFQPSPTHTRCLWKGQASYYTVVVDGRENHDAAWYYPDPTPAAVHIRGRVAFWQGVQVDQVRPGSEARTPEVPTASRWSRLRRIRTP